MISGKKRTPALPQVPTFDESGVTNFDIGSWMGVLAPAGTQDGIIRKMAGELARIMTSPDITAKVIALGSATLIEPPEAFEVRMKEDYVKYADVVKRRNIVHK